MNRLSWSIPVFFLLVPCLFPVYAQEGSPPFTPPSPVVEVPREPENTVGPEPAPGSETSPPSDLPQPTPAEVEKTPPGPAPVPVSVVEKIKEIFSPEETPAVTLKDFAKLPPRVQELILAALRLNNQNLSYKYGAADPSKGGMDCSGTVYYLLRELGWKNVPRQSDAFYRWVWEADQFVAVNGITFNSYEWKKLRPGDLLFWTGTYAVSKDRDPAISHVMIYLGVDEKTGRRIMFGASEGRRYQDKTRSGVGLFDFSLPTMGKTDSGRQPRFVGYGRIPDPPEPKTAQVTNP